MRLAAAWGLRKLLTGVTPGKQFQSPRHRSAGKPATSSANSFSLANESNGVGAAAAASAAVANTMMLLSLSRVNVFILHLLGITDLVVGD
jgi:hypothetical protein